MNSRAAVLSREGALRQAVVAEVLSLAWIMVEVAVGGAAAWIAGSLALSVFSLDSGVEWVSGAVLLVRLVTEVVRGRDQVAAAVERVAAAVCGFALLLLAAYISWESGRQLASGAEVVMSPAGSAVAAASSLLTPWLARWKRRLGTALHSHALLADAACSMTCAYMSWILFVSLAAQWLFGWWWMDAVAALGIVYFVLREGLESVTVAYTGEAHVH
ncbi:membrane protein [Alicyclobacillus contaminans]|uniref:cation transporter n=1 Tax=Alicyclobacillus contaminans TaxID=392016 RepID=UPI00041DEB89|nr:cation transporter [Alicyclobacillus contaminans]GMA52137.1 membrane protein [Alicyclobacillus contaminans]